MTLPPGTRLGSHEIVAPIGAGGMGEVYRATDTKLGRDVALKVLPAEMASSPERLERFQREARAVAALNNPHIVTIYAVEEVGGVHFLTMELVEGQSLDLLIAEGALPVARLLEIATSLADALGAAHEKGIVHRDLKPANVMLGSGGRVKVLDFGLAKVESAGGASPNSTELPTEMQTQEGVVMGTVPYMSPEQVQGRAVDHRTDIFSLGIILYEMATGQRPFHGQSSAELVSSILRDTPPSVVELRADLPEELARVIQRCLEKSISERFPSAQELRYGLRGVPTGAPSTRTGAALASRPQPAADSGAARADEGFWVAVLPFKYGGADPSLTALAEGLTEEIVTGLSRFSYLRVIARSSTSRYARESVDVRSAGKELGARYVMEGSLRQAGTRLRIAVQLVDTSTGAHVWAETYDRSFSPEAMFELQDEITDRVVAIIADPYGVLVRSMATPTASKPPETLTPYEAVQRFFLYQTRGAAVDHLAARVALERAVGLEPGYADAWAGLAIVLIDEDRHVFNPIDGRANALDRALEAALRAVDADSANQMAAFALAQVRYFRGDLGAFRSTAEHAIALNPRDSFTMAFLGLLMAYGGDWERGLELTTRAMTLNPHHPGWYRFGTFFNAYRQRRYAEALAIVQQINMPDYFPTHYAAAIAHAQLGNLPAATEAVARTLQVWPEFERGFVGHLGKWIPNQPELTAHILEGAELAGFRVHHPDRELIADPTAERARPAS